jgi:hypothetical protein
MIPMLCISCQQSHGVRGLFHARDLDTPCPVCRKECKPAAIIHLAIPSSSQEAHPMLKGDQGFMGVPSSPRKIACGFGPRLPRNLTTLPEAATCYACLQALEDSETSPVNTETLE